MEKLTTEQVLRALRRLEKGWPDNLEILVMDGTLNVVNRYPDEVLTAYENLTKSKEIG